MSARGLPLGARLKLATKPASWPKLLVPCLLGQAIGLGAAHRIDLAALGLGLVFTVFDLLFIVLLNDWGDRQVDTIKRQMFPESSLKAIPDGAFRPGPVLIGGLACGVAALATAALAEHVLGRAHLTLLAAGSLLIFVAYSLPPLRLNYRGGGEALEMLGVGVALPWLNSYLQGGETWAPGLALLPGFALLSLGSAIASGLSDERSDRSGGKRTVVGLVGNHLGRRLTEAAALLGAIFWLLAAEIECAPPGWVLVPAAMVALFWTGGAIGISGSAKTDAFEAQRRYKGALHHAIWRGALTGASLLATWHLITPK